VHTLAVSCPKLLLLLLLLAARVHPGETNASWMMKGALHQLLGSSAESVQLREQFVFKVSPRAVMCCVLNVFKSMQVLLL
jgi:hypothetical protein